MKLKPKLTWLLLLSLAALLRWINIGQRSIWLDEAYSLNLAAQPAVQIINGAAMDVHPPLFHLLLSIWQHWFGSSEVALRSFSACCGVLLVAATYQLGKTLVTRQVGWLAAWLVALSPYFVELSRVGRMPALLALLLTLSMTYFWRIIHHQRISDALLWVAVMGSALYTHYFAFLLLAAFHLYLFIGIGKLNLSRSIRKKWLLLQLLLLAGYAPWLAILWKHVTQGGPSWRGSGSAWTEPINLIYNLVLGSACWQWWQKVLAVGLVGLACLLIMTYLASPIKAIYRQAAPRVWGWLLTGTVTMIAMIWLYSVHKLNVFDHRYVSAVAVIIVISLSLAINALADKRQWLVMAVLASSFSIPLYYQLFYPQYYDNWRQLAAVIQEQHYGETVIAVYPAWNENPLKYYVGQRIPIIGLPGHYDPISGQTRPFFHINEQQQAALEARLHGYSDVVLCLVNEGEPQRWLQEWFKQRYHINHYHQLGGLYLWHGKKKIDDNNN